MLILVGVYFIVRTQPTIIEREIKTLYVKYPMTWREYDNFPYCHTVYPDKVKNGTNDKNDDNFCK